MDDVGYLRTRTTEQSFTFFVDSSMRDADVWPTPSEYEIRFIHPVKNCFGVSLLDASVPRTEYTVETTSNELLWSTAARATVAAAVADGSLRSASVPPGDYNLPQLVAALNDALRGDIVLETVSNPPEVTSRLRFVRDAPFSLFMGASSMRTVLGFGNPATVAADAKNHDGTLRFASYQHGYGSATNHTFVSVPSSGTTDASVFAGPQVIPLEEYAETVDANRHVRQTFQAAASGALTFAQVAVGVTTSATLTITVYSENNQVLATGTTPVQPGDETCSVVLNAGGNNVSSGETLVCQVSSDAPVVVYRAEGLYSGSLAEVNSGVNNAWTPLEGDLCLDVFAEFSMYAVESPGPVNLTGTRFVLVRSPDIEAQVGRDRAFEPTSAGLGVCKMSGSGYRDMRFDFSSFQQRTFHPVTLDRIHVRLEHPDGKLYDAHGLDHTLVFLVKFYADDPAVGNVMFPTRPPGYDPDIRRMQLRYMDQELGR